MSILLSIRSVSLPANQPFRLLSREEFTELSAIAKCDYIAKVIEEPRPMGLHLFSVAARVPTVGAPSLPAAV